MSEEIKKEVKLMSTFQFWILIVLTLLLGWLMGSDILRNVIYNVTDPYYSVCLEPPLPPLDDYQPVIVNPKEHSVVKAE